MAFLGKRLTSRRAEWFSGTGVAVLSVSLRRHAIVLPVVLVAALAGCAQQPMTPATVSSSSAVPPEYQSRPDEDRVIPAVNPHYLNERNRRRWVDYTGPEEPGTIVVDPYARLLYHVVSPGRAMRFGIAVGKAGKGFSGNAVISRKVEYPSWTPTKNMIRNDPDLYGPLAGGLPGGLDNPLGARALYLYQGGRDTHYRIHGTNNASTIGRATSAGCIRLYNQDAIDLYNRIDLGTYVHVRTLAESQVIEGDLVENADGLMQPVSDFPPEVQDQIRAGQIPWPKFKVVIGVNATAPVMVPNAAGVIPPVPQSVLDGTNY